MRLIESSKLSLFSFKACSLSSQVTPFGPFNSFVQKRWRKPIISAQTRLEDRTRDSNLDKLTTHLKKLDIILKLHVLMSSRKRGPFVSLQLMSRWRNLVGLNVGIGAFVHKYPHIFEVFTHPARRNLCCRISKKMMGLIEEEADAMKQLELEVVHRVKKLLMMSVSGTLHLHALRLVRRELGLPVDFRESILGKYSKDFKLVDLEVVELISRDENLDVAEIEKWREKEFREKWLSEFETKYAFPINFPTGFEIQAGFRDKLKNWQRLPYVKPYDRKESVRIRTCGGIERYEKRAVGILHEFLSLTAEKMVEVEREAYSKGCLIQSNPIYDVRRKMLDLVFLGSRNTREMPAQKEIKEFKVDGDGIMDGDWGYPNVRELGEWKLKLVIQGFRNTVRFRDGIMDGDWVILV
ncbi:unnamed protein product [Prunus armeniaca]|uniref:PORR domain-containing protein n=1 Tax=Prunus armeniaca TaxID=36596 RepID=A0A6J5TYE7_PRUAR|nr:unnamed protein product [Prunus armeniaca]